METELQSFNSQRDVARESEYSERELALMMVEWRKEAQLAIAELSVELTFANGAYHEASLALIQFNEAHGISSVNDITDQATLDLYADLSRAVASCRQRVGQAGKNYHEGVKTLISVTQGVCDGGEVDTHFEAFIHMPLNKPPAGGHIVGEYDVSV